MTSNDDVQTRPPWLEGEKNIPKSENDTKESWENWDDRVYGGIHGDNEDGRAEGFDMRAQETGNLRKEFL